MDIIIVGTGSVGELLTKYIVKEGHNVNIIDRNPDIVKRITDKYDANGIVGNGTAKDTLVKAGAELADLVIAVTALDEINILCCDIAKKLGAKHTMARVRTPEYISDAVFMRDKLGVDAIVNPEYDCAREIADNIRFPAHIKVEAFADGKIEMTQFTVEEGSLLVGLTIATLKRRFTTEVLISAVKRNEKVCIPRGDYVLAKGDIVTVIGSHNDIYLFLEKLDLIRKKVKTVAITGGERITYYLSEMLESSKIHTKIIASNRKVCLDLSERFPKADVIFGESMDAELLQQEKLEKCDACVTLTRTDKANIAVALYAKSKGIDNIIVLLNNLSFASLLHGVDINFTVSAHYTMLESVLRYVRGIANCGQGGNLKTLYKVFDDSVEALEFDVEENFPAVGIPLMDKRIRLKKNVLVASIVRNGNVISPSGTSSMMAGDRVVIVTTDKKVISLSDILEH